MASLAKTDDSEYSTETSGFWFEEDVTPDFRVKMRLNSMAFNGKSPFQKVQIINSCFGKTLVLDSKTQSAEFDEHIYHESLVHPALLTHPNPKTVFIGGGGEYATAREVLRHPSVERCVMVDIDEKVCRICEKELPEWGNGCTKDPRLEVHYDDAYGFLERDTRSYDVVIMDIADPIEAGPGIALYTSEFYQMMVKTGKLAKNGVFVTQSGPGSVLNSDECMSTIHQTLRTVFTHVLPFNAEIPSFGSKWGFNIAFNEDTVEAGKAQGKGSCLASYVTAGAGMEKDLDAMLMISRADIDALVNARFPEGKRHMHYYDGITHKGMFGLPKKVRDTCENEKRVMTKANPVFMH